MELNESTITAKKEISGSDIINVSAGQSLKIETSPNGEETVDMECPEGKQWQVKIDIVVLETDV